MFLVALFLLTLCSRFPTLSPEMRGTAAKEAASMSPHSLPPPVFGREKKNYLVIKKAKPFGEGAKTQLEQLNIAETLSGICCLLSTVYQSLYLHPGPGLAGESSGALNEMDK